MLSVFFFTSCSDDEPAIPTEPMGSEWIDPHFAKVLEKTGDISSAESVKPSDVADITVLHLASVDLTSMRGIEYFTSLQELYCSSNHLKQLDLSKNTNLTVLWCSYNEIQQLDISGCKILSTLYCFGNKLNQIDITNNIKLSKLACSDNELATLDVSKNTTLTRLSCQNNRLHGLDISRNIALTDLYCSDNPGENGTFNVKAWFDNANVPENFTNKSWNYNGASISINYQK